MGRLDRGNHQQQQNECRCHHKSRSYADLPLLTIRQNETVQPPRGRPRRRPRKRCGSRPNHGHRSCFFLRAFKISLNDSPFAPASDSIARRCDTQQCSLPAKGLLCLSGSRERSVAGKQLPKDERPHLQLWPAALWIHPRVSLDARTAINRKRPSNAPFR
jgi:hypothetical protein